VIVFLLNVYLLILFLLVRLKVVRFNLFWKASPFLVLFVLLIGLFIPMGWGAPSGPAILGRQSVAIVPNVAGEVIDVPVQPNTPLKANDVLFRIDPTPFAYKVAELKAQLVEAQQKAGQLKANLDVAAADVAAVNAQLAFWQKRRDDLDRLAKASTTSEFNLQDAQRQVDTLQAQASSAKARQESSELALNSQIDGVNTDVVRLTAQLGEAQWQLDQTTVRAPSDGYVTNLALRKGARVTSLPLSPVMAFIDTSATFVGVEIPQIDARYIEPGQDVEVTFKFMPGRILGGKVERVLQALSSGQAQPSGQAVTPKQIEAAPFVVRVALDDADAAAALPAGSAGTAAIFTDQIKASHIVRRVLLRQEAIINYINPF
jgi:multidrug resistance efflux pump